MESAVSDQPDVQSPAEEAWELMGRLFAPAGRPRFVQIAEELGLAPQQAKALLMLREPVPMGSLAQALHCDSSNVTGIVDRLETRGLARREVEEADRRVKLLVLTPKGERTRQELARRFAIPPPELEALSDRDQKTLRTLLRKATRGQTP